MSKERVRFRFVTMSGPTNGELVRIVVNDRIILLRREYVEVYRDKTDSDSVWIECNKSVYKDKIERAVIKPYKDKGQGHWQYAPDLEVRRTCYEELELPKIGERIHKTEKHLLRNRSNNNAEPLATTRGEEDMSNEKRGIKAGAKHTAKSVASGFVEGMKDAAVEQSGIALIEMVANAFEEKDPATAAFLRSEVGQPIALMAAAGLVHLGASTGMVPLKPHLLEEFSVRTVRNSSRNVGNQLGGVIREIAMGGFMELGDLTEKLESLDTMGDTVKEVEFDLFSTSDEEFEEAFEVEQTMVNES